MLNVQRNSKLYWPILKTFLNNKKVRTAATLFRENEFVPAFKKKAEIFNSFFAEQYSLQSNESKLPSRPHYFTEIFLSTIKFSSNNIFDIIQLLDPKKALSHDMTIIRMLKTFEQFICRPLELIFNEWISNDLFPSEQKVVPFHKKNNRQSLENYHPVLLLPIFDKIPNEIWRF